ncbi:MAG TPA: SDR family oxidoreductase [Pirellulales bacterium]|jgi:short-subunit dehydrogenase
MAETVFGNRMTKQNIVIVGASSGIAKALCAELAREGNNLVLAGRDVNELHRAATDLKIRYQREVFVEPFEAGNYDGYQKFWADCVGHFADGLHGVVVCHGVLPDQAEAQRNISTLRQSLDVNFISAAAILEVAAAYFEGRKNGFLAAISSVAGDRGRQSNYSYGAAKAGLTAYLQGLRNRLQHSGVHVLTVKPGFVATRMTEGKVNPKSPLLAQPEKVAGQIAKAISRRKNVVYTPHIWWVIMSIICAIPETIFKRLKL